MKQTITMLMMLLVATSTSLADVIPTPWFKMFYGEAFIDGLPAPVGTVVDAYDPDGVHCGTFTVGQSYDTVGIYGMLFVYGDDPWSSDLDEGCVLGDSVRFKVEGIWAEPQVISGNVYWQDQSFAQVNLISQSTIPASVIEPDTIQIFFANAITPFELRACLGDFDSGYTAGDVNATTLLINTMLTPQSTAVLQSHPDFDGEAFEITVYACDFIPGYGYPFDVSMQTYTVTGEYLDGVAFDAVGRFVMIGHTSGDINGDGQGPDVSDLVCLVDYMFNGGPPPPVIAAADVDGSGGIVNIADLVYLVDYMFMGGPAPNCR